MIEESPEAFAILQNSRALPIKNTTKPEIASDENFLLNPSHPIFWKAKAWLISNIIYGYHLPYWGEDFLF